MSVADVESRVVPAFQAAHDASQRFDYFVTAGAGAGAALTFSLQAFDPAKAPLAVALAPVGWALLLLAMLAGFADLSNNVQVLRLGLRAVELTEERIALVRELKPDTVAIHERGTGQFDSRAEVENQIRGIAAERVVCDRRCNRRMRIGRWLQVVRNAGVLGGFFALVLWRALNLP